MILAGEVNKGSCSFDDRIGSCFNFPVSQSCSGITLRQLATHSSGLPRLADNFWPSVRDQKNPYISYSDKELKKYLSSAVPAHAPDTRYDYSNFAFGLLGYYLCMKNGISYDQLVQEKICSVSGMKNTGMTADFLKFHHMATGYSYGLPVKNWDFQDVTAGQGALRSDISDMIIFMDIHLNPSQSVLHKEIVLTQQQYFRDRNSNMRTGLGWHIGTFYGEKYLEHTGGTGGFRSFIGMCPESGTGVVILSNSDNDVSGLGLDILKLVKQKTI
jgi:serine-type D-Ala-D-Ala carboxypeptidase/endopeptidase